MQLALNGTVVSVDDSHIAWLSDINSQFGDVVATNFNTESALRGGGMLNGTLKVSKIYKAFAVDSLQVLRDVQSNKYVIPRSYSCSK